MSHTIKIESGIKIPKKYGSGRCKYPLSKMNVGDSFQIGNKKPTSIVASVYNWKNRNNPSWKFSVRKVGPQMVRVWRIK